MTDQALVNAVLAHTDATVSGLARQIGANVRTVRRWKSGHAPIKSPTMRDTLRAMLPPTLAPHAPESAATD